MSARAPIRPRPRVKCLVWDLDDTLWDGALLEDGGARVGPEVLEVVRAIDERGILQSIASKNDHDVAVARLKSLGIDEYFLYPQVSWGPKSKAIERIAARLNIGIDSIAFIDDQPFERDEVAHAWPQVLILESGRVAELLGMDEFAVPQVTEESRGRRRLYMDDIARSRAEETFEGPPDAFLSSLGMTFRIARAEPADLPRLEELVARTNQLNTTGRIYGLDELALFSRSGGHELWVASLSDRYGDYGKIGVALIEKGHGVLTIKAFLMSCRVMARGVGSVFLTWIVRRALAQGLRLRAEWRQTDRNRLMLVTYRFAGFVPAGRSGDFETLEHRGAAAEYPLYVEVCAPVAEAEESPRRTVVGSGCA